MKTITALEWFIEQLPMRIINSHLAEIAKAKTMEREQIEDAFLDGMQCYPFDPNSGRAELYFESKYKNPEE